VWIHGDRINREEFLQAQRIQSVVERKTTTPILANFLLDARGNQLTYVRQTWSLPVRE
jgi:DNA polymerase III sliding clamp (beta) subunit (PCNA family)